MNTKKIKLVAAVVMALAVGIVVLQNRGEVETKILFVSLNMPQAVLLFLVASVSFGAGILGALYLRSRKPTKSTEL